MEPYANLIGAKYAVVSDDLRAYGVYESSNNRTPSWIDLVPLPIGGSELAFKRLVPQGQIIKILSAWRRPSLLRLSIYYVVEIENWDLPKGVPVLLELSRGNEGTGAELSRTLYKRLPKSN